MWQSARRLRCHVRNDTADAQSLQEQSKASEIDVEPAFAITAGRETKDGIDANTLDDQLEREPTAHRSRAHVGDVSEANQPPCQSGRGGVGRHDHGTFVGAATLYSTRVIVRSALSRSGNPVRMVRLAPDAPHCASLSPLAVHDRACLKTRSSSQVEGLQLSNLLLFHRRHGQRVDDAVNGDTLRVQGVAHPLCGQAVAERSDGDVRDEGNIET